MAVKHDMVTENQNASGAQSKQNLDSLLMILRHARDAEPKSFEQFFEAIVKVLCCEPMADSDKETLVAYRVPLMDLASDPTSEMGQQLIHGCLKCLYRRMVGSAERPGLAASVILALFNTNHIPGAVRWMLKHGENSSDEGLTRVFETLMNWHCRRIVEDIHVWICEMLAGLYEEHRYDLLFDLVRRPLPNILKMVRLPLYRAQCLAILQRMMLCDGHAPKVFHMMLPELGGVIRSFNSQVDEPMILFLRAIQKMVQQFPDPGDRYNQITAILNVCKSKLTLELGAASSLSAASPLVRLENNNPRVGLVNLGNTCYMNSVLQALVMTKHFSRELLLSYPRQSPAHGPPSSSRLKTELVLTIQKLLAQLLHSRRPELTPREVLHVTRPPSFLPGHQQDSSEFLSHLMDTLHEHELAVRNKQQQQQQQQKKKKGTQQPTSPQRRKRMATGGAVAAVEEEDDEDDDEEEEEYEEDDTGINLNSSRRKEEEEEDSEEDTLIQRSFGGLLDTTYHCLSCDQKSTNRDAFRDVSLSFGQAKEAQYYVQHLLDFYCVSEKLEGDNQYHCERCAKLCDGLRSISFVAPPKNLILTLKHFKYDQQFHTRAKLTHNVVLNEMITLKVHRQATGKSQSQQQQQKKKKAKKGGKVSSPVDSASSAAGAGVGETATGGGSGGESTRLAKYQLYAVVVHSGMSMDAGHYYTYACDEPDSWYMFNDSYVTRCSPGDVHRLRAPNTPYILFYRLVDEQVEQREEERQEVEQQEAEDEASGTSGGGVGAGGNSGSLPELEELPSYLKDFVEKDNITYCQEMQKSEKGKEEAAAAASRGNYHGNNNNHSDSDSDDPPPPPPSSCGGNAIDSCNPYIC